MAFRPTTKIPSRSERALPKITQLHLVLFPRTSTSDSFSDTTNRPLDFWLSLRDLRALLFQSLFASGTAHPLGLHKPASVIVARHRDSPLRMPGRTPSQPPILMERKELAFPNFIIATNS